MWFFDFTWCMMWWLSFIFMLPMDRFIWSWNEKEWITRKQYQELKPTYPTIFHDYVFIIFQTISNKPWPRSHNRVVQFFFVAIKSIGKHSFEERRKKSHFIRETSFSFRIQRRTKQTNHSIESNAKYDKCKQIHFYVKHVNLHLADLPNLVWW